jgi:hypothetical protein
MLKLSAKKNDERQKVFDKAEKIKKDPYEFYEETKLQKIKNQETKALIHAKPKGTI